MSRPPYVRKRTARKPFTLYGVEWTSYQTGVNAYTLFSKCERAQILRPSHRVTWRAYVDQQTVGTLFRSETGACKAAAEALQRRPADGARKKSNRFVILYRPTFAELYRVPSYEPNTLGGERCYQGSYRAMESMAWGIELAGGYVRYAFFDDPRGDAAIQKKWHRAELILYREATEAPIPFSTRIRGTEETQQ